MAGIRRVLKTGLCSILSWDTVWSAATWIRFPKEETMSTIGSAIGSYVQRTIASFLSIFWFRKASSSQADNPKVTINVLG